MPVQTSGTDPATHFVVELGSDELSTGPDSTGLASDTVQPQQPAALVPEQNSVPQEQRAVVHDYFNGEGATSD